MKNPGAASQPAQFNKLETFFPALLLQTLGEAVIAYPWKKLS